MLLKCPAVPQRSFLDLISDLWIGNLLLKFIEEPIYCLNILYDIFTFTVQLIFNVVYFSCDHAFESLVEYHVIFLDITTSDTDLSTVLMIRVFWRCQYLFKLLIMFIDSTKHIAGNWCLSESSVWSIKRVLLIMPYTWSNLVVIRY